MFDQYLSSNNSEISHLVNTGNEKVSPNFLRDMENQDILQINPMNSLLPSLEQQQVESFVNDSLQLPDSTMNLSGSFSGLMSAEIGEYELEVNFDQAFDEIFGSLSKFEASTTTSELPTPSDNFDPLIGNVSTLLAEVVWDSAVSTTKEQLEAFTEDLAAGMYNLTVAKVGEQLELLTTSNDSLTEDETSPSALAALELGVLRVKEQLETFADREDFLELSEQAFDDNVPYYKLNALIQDLASGEAIPEIKIVSADELNNANGAFGQNTIYLAEEFLIENATNPEAVESVLLEEIGHFVDEELGGSDSRGDEGDIFSRVVRGETVNEDELEAIKAEDDSATISLDGEEINVELATSSPISADAAERKAQDELADKAASYPGYALKYDPSNPNEYDEDPEVVRMWQQRMADLGYKIDVDGYYGQQSDQVARQFQEDNGLEVDGYVGPKTWEASFSLGTPTAKNETSSAPSNTEVEIESYESLYEREFAEEAVPLFLGRESAETTWNMTAQEMLEENKDFLKKAAERYGIDGRAIAGAIRWEYEENWDSRLLDEIAYLQVQDTGSLDSGLNGNGWGKMHYSTAQNVLEESGEEVPNNQTLAMMLAVPTSSIDLIARFMQQAAQAYSKYGFDISDDPAVLTTLYRIGEDDMSFEERAKDTKDKGKEPKPETEGMGNWVADNLASLKDYQT